MFAAAPSQSEMLAALRDETNIEWQRITAFHMDEYIGLEPGAPQRFGNWLSRTFFDHVPLKQAHLIEPGSDPGAACTHYASLLAEAPMDLVLLGIGTNGHLAFNDPPADFETEKAYLIVDLDEPCRRQQMNEGWFGSLEEVPTQAISMSVRQILKSRHIICSVPDARKAQAVKDSLEQPVSNRYPASILREHADCRFYLDEPSASLLETRLA